MTRLRLRLWLWLRRHDRPFADICMVGCVFFALVLDSPGIAIAGLVVTFASFADEGWRASKKAAHIGGDAA